MKTKAPYLIILAGIVIFVAFIVPSLGGSRYLDAARAGGDYLISHMYEDGSFVYEYDPIEQEESDSYNILRHAGTTYSLLELYEATRDQRYLHAAHDALRYLAEQIGPCPGVNDAECIIENEEIKLGGNGLAILAFTKYVQVTQKYPPKGSVLPARFDVIYGTHAKQLAKWVVSIQAPSGEFIVHKLTNGTVDEFESGYYPGEAIFALTRLYEIDQDPVWIDTAHKGAHWLIDVRDANVPTPNLNHDHWLLYGLNELYTNRPDEAYLTHARRIVDSIVAIQHHGETGDRAAWNGGFYDPPRSTPTATRSEGLGAAYLLFTRAGDETYTTTAKHTMKKALEFQLRTQFTGTELAKLGGDTKAAGAFHESLDAYEIRIDYVQHNVSALLAFERIEDQK